MSVPLTINGAIFNYPVNFDTNWGIDATGWAQAVTSGMLQKAGGSFPLTAEVDFGASFGLKALYFKSRTATPSTVGTLRLASADPGIGFRNNIGNSNLILTTNASDDLVWPSGIAIQNAHSLKLLDSGSSHTISMKSPATTATYTLTLPPNTGSAGQVLSTDGSGTTTWINAAGGGTVDAGTGTCLAWYAANGTTIDSQDAISYNTGTSQLRISPPGGTTQASMYLQSVAIGGPSAYQMETNGEVISMEGRNDGTFHIIDVSLSNREILAYNDPFGSPHISTNMPLDMRSHQVNNLSDATASTDATAFGQVQYGFQNAVQFSSLGAASVSSGSYATTGISVTITPTSSSSRIKISVTASIATTSGHLSIFRGSTNLAGSDKDFAFFTSTAALGIAYIDSPATTSATTYTIYAKGTVTVGGANILTTMIAEELR